ncbi:MAG: hypothetical protein QOJ65_776, partial [Fimbriimonadaceae bacterium]|nr:hypothetical protein [Fimbriimonadaceae bacterium]
MRNTHIRYFAALVAAAIAIPAFGNFFGGEIEPLTKETKDTTIQALVKQMKDVYFFTDLTPKVEQDLLARNAKGEYDSFTSGEEFAKKLTEDMNALCHDAHLRVRFSKDPLPVRKNN